MLPPSGFASRTLDLTRLPKGSTWCRIYESRHPNPLGFVPSPSRFSDPDGTHIGLVYVGSTPKVAFLEAILRDQFAAQLDDAIFTMAELGIYTCADIEIAQDLNIIDLTGDECIRRRVPTDVIRAQDHTLARAWSEAFYGHPDQPDGILYPSRLNGHTNIAVYDRAVPKLRAVAAPALLDRRADMAAILTDFDLKIV